MIRQPEQNLRVPGPTPLPPEVREALARPMINHRSPDYEELQAEVLANLQYFFQTEHEVLLFAASGTGGLEAAAVNMLSPGDRVLAVTMGAFGDRLAEIAASYGATVQRMEIPWGQAADPQAVAATLAAAPATKAVLVTCNETSTGVMNDMAALAQAIHSAPSHPLLIADAVSALGAVDLPMDRLGIDVLITGSQKAWMAPPGLTMIGVGPRGWETNAAARIPRYYFDFARQRKAQAKHQDAWTPAVSTLFALRAALRLMRTEGLPAIVARHARIAAVAQQGFERLGLPLVAAPGYRSHTVTAAHIPAPLDAGAVIRRARQDHNLVLAGGQGRLEGKIVRLGHLGWVDEADVTSALHALQDVVRQERAARG
jgi:aspartate aminotransferase-like enzyme